MFKKFECGCVGFVVTDYHDKRVIYRLIDCRQSGDFLDDGIDIREATSSLEVKASEKLPPEEVEELLKSLSSLVSAGHDMKRMSFFLNAVLQRWK